MLELIDVTKTYDGKTNLTVLRGVSIAVGQGEMLAIMGPSGSGKSTLLNLIGGLDVPTSGTVSVLGSRLDQMTEEQRSLFRRSHLSYVFQAYHLMPTLTAEQNAALPLQLAGCGRREVEERVAKVLDEVGLGERAAHLPDELSGGERQRVAIARALVTNPRILLADEPTGNLDTARGEEILGLLKRIHQQHGTTIIMVTHDTAAAASCERLVRIRDGRIVDDARS